MYLLNFTIIVICNQYNILYRNFNISIFLLLLPVFNEKSIDTASNKKYIDINNHNIGIFYKKINIFQQLFNVKTKKPILNSQYHLM